VLLWHTVPLAGVAVTYARIERIQGGRGVFAVALLVLVAALGSSVAAAWMLSSAHLGRAVLVGNLAALPGIVLTGYVLVQALRLAF
jgi:hypothetical protein